MNRIGIIILAVENLELSTSFYRRAFGWQPSVETGTYVELEIPGGLRLGVYRFDGYSKNFGEPAVAAHPGEALTRTEIYVYVTDLKAALERVVGGGGRLLNSPAFRSWGDTCAYVSDPDGNVIVLAVAGQLSD